MADRELKYYMDGGNRVISQDIKLSWNHMYYDSDGNFAAGDFKCINGDQISWLTFISGVIAHEVIHFELGYKYRTRSIAQIKNEHNGILELKVRVREEYLIYVLKQIKLHSESGPAVTVYKINDDIFVPETKLYYLYGELLDRKDWENQVSTKLYW